MSEEKGKPSFSISPGTGMMEALRKALDFLKDNREEKSVWLGFEYRGDEYHVLVNRGKFKP